LGGTILTQEIRNTKLLAKKRKNQIVRNCRRFIVVLRFARDEKRCESGRGVRIEVFANRPKPTLKKSKRNASTTKVESNK